MVVLTKAGMKRSVMTVLVCRAFCPVRDKMLVEKRFYPFIFSSRNGIVACGSVAANQNEESHIKIFTLANSPAPDVADILRQLIPTAKKGSPLYICMRVDAATNSIIVKGSEGDLKIVESLLKELDGEATARLAYVAPVPGYYTAEVPAETR